MKDTKGFFSPCNIIFFDNCIARHNRLDIVKDNVILIPELSEPEYFPKKRIE